MQKSKYIILFDGVCNLCNSTVVFILQRDKYNRFLFAALQSNTARNLWKDGQNYSTDLQSIVLLKKDKIYDQSSAALHIAKELSGAWPLLFYMFIWIPKGIRDTLYKFVAKRRYKWFGKRGTCMISLPKHQNKFLE